MLLEDLECPGCGAGKLIRDSDNALTCSSCGNRYDAKTLDAFVEHTQEKSDV